MNNKKVATLLSVCTAATMLTACDNFNPAAEYEVDMYGPAPIIQEESEDAQVEEEEQEQEPELEDDFDAESDSLLMRAMYGVAEIQER